MDAGIATDQRPVVHCESVRIARVWFKLSCLQHAAGFGIVLHEPRPVIGISFAIVANDLPDGAVVLCNRVISRLRRILVERNDELWLPGVRIHTNNRT